LEIVETIETLKGRGPEDVETLSVLLAARMVRLAGLAATVEEAAVKVRDALNSGRGLEKFRALIESQGGDPRAIDDYDCLPTAPYRAIVRADRAGYVQGFDALAVGRAACALGAGRDRVEDAVDRAVGALVLARPSAAVRSGDPLIELHYRDRSR